MLGFVRGAGGHSSPSRIKIFHLLSVLLLVATAVQTAAPFRSTSPCCCLRKALSSLSLQDGAAEQGTASLPEPPGLRARACGRHGCWRTGPSLQSLGLWLWPGAGAAGSMGGPGGAGRRRAGEPRQRCGGLHLTCTDSSCPGKTD